MSEIKVVRVIRGYEKDGDELLAEYQLDPIPLWKLQKLFGEPGANPMYDSYKIDKEQFENLKDYVSESIDWDNYEFYLECNTDD